MTQAAYKTARDKVEKWIDRASAVFGVVVALSIYAAIAGAVVQYGPPLAEYAAQFFDRPTANLKALKPIAAPDWPQPPPGFGPSP